MKRIRIKINGVKIMSVNGKRIMRLVAMLVFGVAVVSCNSPKNVGYCAKLVKDNGGVVCAHYKPLYDYSAANDTNAVQIKVCQTVLNECVECGILDAKSVAKINAVPSVNNYMELIDECAENDIFYDTVAEGDAWCIYVETVLQPREQLAKQIN